MCEDMHKLRLKLHRHKSKHMLQDTRWYACITHTFTAIQSTAAVFMSGICSELHYHGWNPAFVLGFVGFPACICLCQMSRLCRLCILSISVNNQTYNIMGACRPLCTGHIDTFLCVLFCSLSLKTFSAQPQTQHHFAFILKESCSRCAI